MPKTMRRDRVNWLLLSILIVCSAGFVVAGYLYHQNDLADTRLRVLGELETVADLKVSQIAGWRAERLGDGQALAHNYLANRAIEAYLTAASDPEARRQIVDWLQAIRDAYQYAAVLLLDSTGSLCATTLPETEVPCPVDPQLVEQALRSRQVVLSDLFRDQASGHIHLDAVVPLLTSAAANEAPVGVVVLRSKPDTFLYPLIQTWPTYRQSAETLLVRREGDDVLFLNELRHRQNTALSLRLPVSLEDLPAARAARGEVGSIEGKDYRGVPVIAVLREVPDTGWYLVAKIDSDEAYARVYQRAYLVWGMVVALVAATGGGVAFFWRWRREALLQKEIERRVQVEAELRKERDRAEKYFEVAGAILVVLDPKGKVTLINQAGCRLTGYSEAEIIGKNWFDTCLPTGVRSAVKDVFRRLMNGEIEPLEYYENPILTRGGEERLIAWHNVLLRDETGRAIGILSSGVDITDRRRAEDELRRLNLELEQRVLERTAQLEAVNKELEAFNYSVSHDLRAPLRSIDGFSQALLEDYAAQLPEQARAYLQRVRAASQRMGHLIDDLLRLSRLSRTEMTLREVDLSAMAQAIADELHKSQPQRQVEFRIAPGMNVHADPALMQVLLQNLLDNAWKFSQGRSPAVIEFGVTDDQGRPTFYVRDNGVGFDMAYAGKLFSPFQRLHPRSEFEGTGIGLAIVQRVAHRHGGQVWVEAAVDQGATFYFTLE